MSFVSRTPESNYRANWREPSGHQKAKTFRTKTEAKRFLTEIDGSLSRGLYVDLHAGRLLFATHAREWLDSHNDELTAKARDASIMHTHVLQWARGRSRRSITCRCRNGSPNWAPAGHRPPSPKPTASPQRCSSSWCETG
jgi:hypothetical protein